MTIGECSRLRASTTVPETFSGVVLARARTLATMITLADSPLPVIHLSELVDPLERPYGGFGGFGCPWARVGDFLALLTFL